MKQKRATKATKAISLMMVFILLIQVFMEPLGQLIVKASSNMGIEENVSQEDLQNLMGLNVTSGSAINTETSGWQIPNYETGFHVIPENGVTIIQSKNDPNYYTDNYWNTLNKNKLPGTTVLASDDVNVTSGSSIGVESSWHGAKLDANHFINAINLNQDVVGQKSYFVFDNQIACLGAGINNISSDTNREVNTIIDNIKYDDIVKDKVNLRYSTKTISTWISSNFFQLGNTYTYLDNPGGLSTNKHWALALPYGSSVGTGYYFKANEKDINTRFVENTDELNNKKIFMELWLNHGTVKDASYAYYIFKDLKASDPAGTIRGNMTANIATIIANTKDIQAAYYKASNTVSANIWAAQGATVEYNAINNFTVDSQSSIIMRKKAGILDVAIAEPTGLKQGTIEVVIDSNGYEVVTKNDNVTVDFSLPGKIKLIIDVTGQNGDTSKVSINTIPPAIDGNLSSFDIVKGKSVLIPTPDGFEAPVTWNTIFKNADGMPIKNVGSSKKKEELKPGETDGTRVEGITSTSHIASVEGIAEGGLISTQEKGTVFITAVDKNGKFKEWKLNVSYTDKENLPVVQPQDYQDLREKWATLLVGQNLDTSDSVIMSTVDKLNIQAQDIWNRYSYKGQSVCGGIPWKDEEGVKGNPNIEYKRDAVEFRSAFQNLLIMAKAYSVEHGALYHNNGLLQDMIHILDWLTTNCYCPKSQTDNWWTWEIGIPKDLVPTLILLSDELTQKQKESYTQGLLFFQPDPFHGGAIGTGSTHVEGYRMQYAANRVDNSLTAMGLGLLLEDNEQMYLAQLASSSVLEFKTVEDSNLLSKNGYENGFYADGSYIDHQNIPYAGSYGVVVLEGVVNIAAILSNSPWQYNDEKSNILESILLKSYGIGVYNGLMLDMLRGRAVSRSNVTGRTIGRQVINNTILSLDSVGSEEKKILLNYLKNWISSDPSYIESLTELNQLVIKQKAKQILNDTKISGVIPSMHQNFPLMDRVIHRTEDWLFGVSMFSERINNTEIMNGENLYGWHQGDGMTYLYNQDNSYYIDNYWNTINPFRLPGTTTVSKNIGNGVKDSSGFYQEGDYVSKEDWVGGSMLSKYGVNGMSLSGDNEATIQYEPNLRALKSYFMFDNEIVCLGSGIRDSESDYFTESTVENRKLNADATNKITVNGSKLELPLMDVNVSDIVNQNGLGSGSASMEGTDLSDTNWIHMQGNIKGTDIGWYFPKGNQHLKARKVASTGNWNNINITESKDVVTNYFELWFDHGKNPQNEEYSYVILPGRSESQMNDYAKNPSIEVLANNSDVQAVYYKKDNVTGANFWNDKSVTVGNITCDKKASIIVKETGGILEIGVSDPTMKNTGTIEVEIAKEFDQIINADKNVQVTSVNKNLHVSVDTNKMNGTTSYAVVKLKTGDGSINPTEPTQPTQPEDSDKDNSITKTTENIDKVNNQIITSIVTSGKDEKNNEIQWIQETVKSLDTGKIIEYRKKVNFIDVKTGEKVQTQLIKDVNGKILNATVSADTNNITQEVNNKEAVITAKFTHSNILKAIAETSKNEKGNILYEAKLLIPIKNTIKELNKSTVKSIETNIELSQDLLNASNVYISNIVMKKEILQLAKAKSANINLCVKNSNNEKLYTWSIKDSDLKKSKKKITDINIALKALEVKELMPLQEAVTGLNNKSEGIVLRFEHDGELPVLATIKLYDTQKIKYAKGQKLYLYYYNEDTRKFHELYYNQCKSMGQGTIEVKVQHCSDYVVLPNKLSNNVVVSLLDQVSISPKMKVETGKNKKLFVNADENAKISYESNNKSVVTVDQTGMIRGKKYGKALIKVKVTLKGKVKIFTTEVNVSKN